MNELPIPQPHLDILSRNNIFSPQVLGRGREGTVYSIGEDKAIKIFNCGDLNFLKALTSFYQELNQHLLPYQIPLIYSIDEQGGKIFTIEKRLHGRELDQVFPSLNADQKMVALTNYFKAIESYNNIQYPEHEFGQAVSFHATTRDSWTDFLLTRLEQRISAQPRLRSDVHQDDSKQDRLKQSIRSQLHVHDKALVHADYYFTNVMVNDQLEVSAVLDFGEHAVIGDRRMDVAAAVSFLEVSPYVSSEMKVKLLKQAQDRYGQDIGQYIDIYTLFFGYYFADTQDEGLYQWSLSVLNNEATWERI